MKRELYFVLLLVILKGPVCLAQSQAQKLEVIYFHATRRCPTCMAIEENTKKTLDTYFKDQLKSGTIKFTVINVDEEKNKQIAEKYEATGSALFLTKTVDGKETKTDMTEFAFSYARNNPDKFTNGLKDKINTLLK
jgi:hypothetical protein